MLKRCEREVMMVDDLALANFVRFIFSFLLLFGKPIKGHIDPCTLPNRRDELGQEDGDKLPSELSFAREITSLKTLSLESKPRVLSPSFVRIGEVY